MSVAIAIENLTKEYPVGFWRRRMVRALDRLTLEVEPGEIFGFLGPNGAGKTTTLKLLIRAIFPTSGTARILGRSIEDVSVHQHIGFAPEQPVFPDLLTPGELLDYYGRLFGLGGEDRRKRTGEVLRVVGLEPPAVDLRLRTFSRGMLQRLSLAQALMNDPQVVILDEPMAGLDPLGRRQIRDILSRLRGQGKTIFFSTHILSDVEALCDRVAVLKRGTLVACGTLAELAESQPSHTLEIVVAGHLPEEARQALSRMGGAAFEMSAGIRIEVSSERVYQALDIVRQHGGQLLSVNPARPALETLFLDE